MLTPSLASQFVTLALSHVSREYPNKLEHVLTGPTDLRTPSELHPVFFGSFDWHSCVHAFWLMARCLRQCPGLPQRDAIHALFDARLTETHVATEVSYLEPAHRATFERPYGWAWVLMLAAELAQHDTPDGRRWSAAITPLARTIAEKWLAFLPRATYPIRVGTHFNTAFAIALSLEYTRTCPHPALETALHDAARRWYGADRACQAWEPGGDEFLSSALIEAECMRRVLPPSEFATWFALFLPKLAAGEPASILTPAVVSDRTDGKIAHLDGLNLSRAWCWRKLADALPSG